MKLNQRERNIAIVAGGVLGVAVLYSAILEPLISRITTATDQIDSANVELLAATELFKNEGRARTAWKQIVGDRLTTDASTAESQLLNNVRDAAQNAGLAVQSLKPDRSEKDNGFQRSVVRVGATGNMSRISRFLYTLQTSDSPLRVVDLAITARKEGTDDLSISVGVATIFDPPPAPKLAQSGARKEAVQ